jgi:hypothetical protein
MQQLETLFKGSSPFFSSLKGEGAADALAAASAGLYSESGKED